MNILILREEELYFFLPPLSTQRRPDVEEDTAREGPDGFLRQSDGIEYECKHYTYATLPSKTDI